jgi:hypothetical protein
MLWLQLLRSSFSDGSALLDPDSGGGIIDPNPDPTPDPDPDPETDIVHLYGYFLVQRVTGRYAVTLYLPRVVPTNLYGYVNIAEASHPTIFINNAFSLSAYENLSTKTILVMPHSPNYGGALNMELGAFDGLTWSESGVNYELTLGTTVDEP